jgi:hypothetical protein
VASVVHEPLRRSVPLDEDADAVRSAPPVGTLTAGVRAVEPTAPGSMELGNRDGAHRAGVLPDHVTRHMGRMGSGRQIVHAASVQDGCGTRAMLVAVGGGDRSDGEAVSQGSVLRSCRIVSGRRRRRRFESSRTATAVVPNRLVCVFSSRTYARLEHGVPTETIRHVHALRTHRDDSASISPEHPETTSTGSASRTRRDDPTSTSPEHPETIRQGRHRSATPWTRPRCPPHRTRTAQRSGTR